MAQYKIIPGATADTYTATKTGEDTLFENIIDGLKAPFLAEDVCLSAGASMWGVALYSFGASVVGGLVARSRAEQGKPAMAGFFY